MTYPIKLKPDQQALIDPIIAELPIIDKDILIENTPEMLKRIRYLLYAYMKQNPTIAFKIRAERGRLRLSNRISDEPESLIYEEFIPEDFVIDYLLDCQTEEDCDEIIKQNKIAEDQKATVKAIWKRLTQ